MGAGVAGVVDVDVVGGMCMHSRIISFIYYNFEAAVSEYYEAPIQMKYTCQHAANTLPIGINTDDNIVEHIFVLTLPIHII
jgi:hypothetical protein